jgi:hypothetical protein
MYTVAIVAMATLFRVAGLTGPTHAARPLSFATSYAYVPAALACELVYLTALVAGIVATVRQCRGPDGVIALPERPELARSLRLFAAAVALDLAYVACTATAALAAARGEHRLDFLAALGSLASGTSALVASYGLAKPALAARAAERRDHEILLRLWATVIGAPGSPAPRPARWWNSRYALTDLIVDILDGLRALHPWMSPAPARAVDDLTPDTRAAKPGPAREADAPYQPDTAVDLLAVKAAATLRHAHASCAAAQPVATPSGGAAWPFASAASGIPATGERAHLVQVARHLNHPLVAAALHRTTTGATLTGSARRTGAQQHPVGRDYDGLREGK